MQTTNPSCILAQLVTNETTSRFVNTRLRDGQFYTRRAMSFQFEDRFYCLVLAIDGNRRALNNYHELDRRGQKRSGIRLTDQRGTFICSQGMKICPYNQIFEHSKLEDYALLGKDDGQSHYVFMINGSFELVTNRNDLSESALKILKNEVFMVLTAATLKPFQVRLSTNFTIEPTLMLSALALAVSTSASLSL